MKKLLALLLTLVLLATAFVGCDNNDNNPPYDNPDNTSSDTTESVDDTDNTTSEDNAENGDVTIGGGETTDNDDTNNDETTNDNKTSNDNETENDNPPQEELNASEGLEFRIESGYAVLIGRGTCKDEAIVIPSYYMGVPVTAIGDYVFMNDTKLKSLTIPQTVTKIGDLAIRNCPYLQELILSDSIVDFGGGLFWGCNALPFVEYNEVYYFGSSENPYMFLYTRANPQIVSHAVHKDTKYICGIGFEGVKTLENIILPDGLLVIDNGAFQLCSELKKINIPDSVTTIYGSAFNECVKLEEVTLGKGLVKLGEYVFNRCGATFYFNGTEAEWAVIANKVNWAKNSGVGSTPICTDTVTE